jgi:succinate dehydrogenase assembly factor 2
LSTAAETDDKLRQKLIYRSRKRGILETDLLLSTFCHNYVDKFDTKQLKEYQTLLDEFDWDIYYWLVGKRPIPEDVKALSIWEALHKHAQNEARKALRMPDLVN